MQTVARRARHARQRDLPRVSHAPVEPGGSPDPNAHWSANTSSTLDDQTELAVTVYNSNIALVRDVRNLQLPQGRFDLHFMDIAATVNPATVHFRSLTEPSRVNVLEQNYEYDLLDPDKLLHKYVGRDVTLVRTAPGGRHDAREKSSRRVCSATTPRRSGGSATRS